MDKQDNGLIQVLREIKDSLNKNLNELSKKLSRIENELSALSRTEH